MVKERITPRRKRPQRRRAPEEERSVSQPAKDASPMPEATFLQHQIGNRAVQQAILQREAASPGANLFDPRVTGAAAQAVISATEAPVRSWLAMNTNRLRIMNMVELVAQVRQHVTEASRLADVEIQNLVREWAASQNINIPPAPVLGAGSDLSIQLPDTVKKAFSIAIDGVDVIPLPNGRLNISAKGATAKLKRGELSLGWTGSLGMDIPLEGFQLAGKLDKEKWELTLSVPGEASIPDMSKLTDVFQKAETAMREMVVAGSKFGKLEDIGKVKKAISPHVEPVKEAVEALVKTAKAPRVSAALKLEGPISGTETPGSSSPAGITVTATVTVRF